MTDDIAITYARTEDLEQSRRQAIIDLCIDAHDNEDFKNLFSYIRTGGRHFMAYRGSEIVGHAVVTARWLQPEGHEVLRTAYVDAVSTSPAYQGRGYGSELMRYLAEHIDDYVIGGLETEKHSFYRRVGWELWRGPLAGRSETGLVPTPEQHGVMVLRLPQTPAVDLDLGLTIECQEKRIW